MKLTKLYVHHIKKNMVNHDQMYTQLLLSLKLLLFDNNNITYCIIIVIMYHASNGTIR